MSLYESPGSFCWVNFDDAGLCPQAEDANEQTRFASAGVQEVQPQREKAHDEVGLNAEEMNRWGAQRDLNP
ncbi:MAG: hypothetical protein K7J46_12485 [Bryobacter sp.]|nr:hypothetical protein [Bryobacter sp. CoA8 C33]